MKFRTLQKFLKDKLAINSFDEMLDILNDPDKYTPENIIKVFTFTKYVLQRNKNHAAIAKSHAEKQAAYISEQQKKREEYLERRKKNSE